MSSTNESSGYISTKVFSALYGLVGYGLTYCIKFMPGMLEAAMIIGRLVHLMSRTLPSNCDASSLMP